MMHLLIKYGNIVLTSTTGRRVWYHLCLLLLVRQSGYIVNLSDFYSYRLIGKLTDFFTASGVQSAQFNSGQFHFRRAAFAQQIKGKVGVVLAKATTLARKVGLALAKAAEVTPVKIHGFQYQKHSH
jgi:hypothetical protein